MTEKLTTLFRQVLDKIPEPRKTIFLERTIAYKNPSTLQKLGDKLEYSREGIRLFENQTKSEIAIWLKEEKYSIFKKLAEKLHNELGKWFPNEGWVLEEAFKKVTGQNLSSLNDEVIGFLLYLAGPYKLRDSWYVAQDQELISAKELRTLENKGIVTYQDAYKHLVKMGLKPAFVDKMLFEYLKCLRINDVLISRSGMLTYDFLAAVLRAVGKPLTVSELVKVANLKTTEKSLLNSLSRAPQIIRVTKDKWGLKEWGYPEYKGIAEAMTQEIVKNKGAMSLKELSEILYVKFGIKPSSVYSYSGVPRFIVEDGVIRLRKTKDPLDISQSLTMAKGTFRVGNKINYLIELDKNHLRGSGFAIPKSLALALGLEPGTNKVWRADNKEVRLYWSDSGLHPSAGSVKTIAEAMGLSVGDMLRIEFDTEKPVAKIHKANVDRNTPALTALSTLTGINKSQKPLEAVAKAIGVEPDKCVSTLNERGDKLVAKFLKAALSSK